jgi:Putative peptidoglycan binding domain
MLLEAAFWLAILPPLFAILVEACNPINGTSIRASAALDLTADFGGLSRDDFDALLGVIEQSGAAIGEASGLASTLIASIISGIAVLHEVSSPYWPIVVYVLIFIILAIFPLWLMSGLTYAQISARNASIPNPWRTIRIPLKRTKVISLTIYAANFVLIFCAILAFATKEAQRDFRLTFGAAGAAAVDRQRQALSDWGETQELLLRLDYLEGQITGQGGRITRLEEQVMPLTAPPASEAFLGPHGWQRIQVGLVRAGFDPGPIDGRSGPKTRAAIRRFQQQESDGAGAGGVLTPREIAQLWPGGAQP